MAKYRKLPVEIEARQLPAPWNLDERTEFEDWAIPIALTKGREFRWTNDGALISTLEGDMEASPGDYIICGVDGELYPCRADIFERTYEAA